MAVNISAVVFLLSLAALPAECRVIVNRGSTGTISFPIANYSDVNKNLPPITLSVNAPAFFELKIGSQLGPEIIPAGSTFTFTARYEITSAASAGDFNASFTAAVDPTLVLPTNGSLPVSTTVEFTVDLSSPSNANRNADGDPVAGSMPAGKCLVAKLLSFSA